MAIAGAQRVAISWQSLQVAEQRGLDAGFEDEVQQTRAPKERPLQAILLSQGLRWVAAQMTTRRHHHAPQ
ncbi:hypothetical protein NDU88_001079 [Pleurodeles waltl]|uniref:Uncharacterized protein n=1 Tax=Pleurodeles waltl TaxID=8319 RepID=A0AAV7U7E3_PLEWA|nr:hypothetical protein NDU88_001079 [Pleurodeles waltl]